MGIMRKIGRVTTNLPNFVRELVRIPLAIQEGRHYLNANPITIGGEFSDSFDAIIWTHATSPPPANQDSFVVIKQQDSLYTVAVGDFCFCGDGSIYRCTDATVGALVWETIGGGGAGGLACIKTVSTNYELVAGDDGCIIRVDSTATITLPDGLDELFQVIVANVGAGVVTLSAATTLNSIGTDLTTQYSAASIVNIGTDVWEAYGRIC